MAAALASAAMAAALASASASDADDAIGGRSSAASRDDVLNTASKDAKSIRAPCA